MTDKPDKYAPFVRDSAHYSDPALEPLPNLKPVDIDHFLGDLTSRGHMMEYRWGYTRTEPGGRSEWTALFIMDHARYGVCYAVRYEGGNKGGVPGRVISVYTWALCDHEFEAGPGGNPSRGWSPGRCKKCGEDMSVDSGD